MASKKQKPIPKTTTGKKPNFRKTKAGAGMTKNTSSTTKVEMLMAKKGLYANIHAKRKRIKAGSNEKMRKPGSKGAPTDKSFKRSAKTAKKK